MWKPVALFIPEKGKQAILESNFRSESFNLDLKFYNGEFLEAKSYGKRLHHHNFFITKIRVRSNPLFCDNCPSKTRIMIKPR